MSARNATDRERSAERLCVSGVEQLPVPCRDDLDGAVDHFDGRLIICCVPGRKDGKRSASPDRFIQ